MRPRCVSTLQSINKKKKAIGICPGCQSLGIEEILIPNSLYKCLRCQSNLDNKKCKEYKLYSAFAIHNHQGYKCFDCSRFIPKPLESDVRVTCPYMDCFFIGDSSSLSFMRHPSVMKNYDFEININQISASSKLEEIIDSVKNTYFYTSRDYTKIHYVSMCEAYAAVAKKMPNEMQSYLIDFEKGNALQHKIFQEYISILESKLPFGFRKNNKSYLITSLLDENLSIFDGISVFESFVNKNKFIKNETKEIYIGGRGATYAKPFYIGKLLDITNDDVSILNDVGSHSFSKIKMKSIEPGTKVKVTHLRIPPHYQMGGMCYLNRVNKKIVSLSKENKHVD